MPGDCPYREHADQIVALIEEQAESWDMNTDQLAHFWRHFTEAAWSRMMRLNPEIAEQRV